MSTNMTGITKQITNLELRLVRKPDVKTAIALSLRCWWVYKNADFLIETPHESRSYLHKAHHTVLAALRKNESHVQLFMLAIFIAIEADRFDNANEMLDKAMGYRSFLRSNEPFYYANLRFLYAYLEIRQKRARSARKHIRALEEFINASGDDINPVYSLMLGHLSLCFYEYDKAYAYLAAAYDGGCRSIFLYQSLYIYYRTSVSAPCGATLLPVINWAAAHQSDVADIIAVYPDELRTAILKDPSKGETIYENAPHPFVLREICASRMMTADFSKQAYRYYREAERRQIYLNGLYTFLIKAARENKVERINHYAMTEFLRAAERQTKPMETELSIYVYHLILTEPVLTDLVSERKNIILQLATHCLEKNRSGREVNSLYAYYWEQCKIMNVAGEWLEKAEENLYNDLTRFTVELSDEVKFIYVTEPERKGMLVYEPQDNQLVLEAVGEDLDFTCLGSGRKDILPERPVAKRMVSQAGFTLYRYFFRKGNKSFYLLAYLANYYLTWLDEMTEAINKDDFNEAIKVFESLLEEGSCAKPYRMRILAALGRLHYAAGHFSKALEQYSAIEESELDGKYLEQILHVFLQTNEWARAIDLVKHRGMRMEKQALFDAVLLLSGPDRAAHHKELAGTAYELLVNGCYDAELLTMVLTHFNGSLEEWQRLSNVLDTLAIQEPRLDELIVKNSLWSYQWDANVQKAFVRLSSNTSVPAGLQSRFVEFCVYEMLVNGSQPDYDTLSLLENAFLSEPETYKPILAWALCHVYLRNKIITFQSDKILSEAMRSQEEAGILFPVFHENRTPLSSPYIEKNQPFLYKGLPDKDVWLYYRVDDTKAFNAHRMTYVRFGLYLTIVPLFYNETLTYYFSEEMPSGSITTKENTAKNSSAYLYEGETEDVFFTLNNAVIYEQMFKYEQVEGIINGLVKDVKAVRGALL